MACTVYARRFNSQYMKRGCHLPVCILLQNGVLHTLNINYNLKKWCLGEVNIIKNHNIMEMGTRKRSEFMCKCRSAVEPVSS